MQLLLVLFLVVNAYISYCILQELTRLTGRKIVWRLPKLHPALTDRFSKSKAVKIGASEKDILYEDALIISQQFDQVSPALFQRKLKIGYARVNRILDDLTTDGYVTKISDTSYLVNKITKKEKLIN